jgi:hypothetical protein
MPLLVSCIRFRRLPSLSDAQGAFVMDGLLTLLGLIALAFILVTVVVLVVANIKL